MINPFRPRDLIKAYRNIFNGPEGQLVLHDLMRNHFIFRTTKGDPGSEGQREVVLRILNILNREKELPQLSKEAHQFQIVSETQHE